MLGLTGTPDRTDEWDVLGFYDGNLIHEIEKEEAITKGWITPFKYMILKIF
mgnify:CR=1 FL=1